MSAGGEVAPSTVDMSDRKSRMVTQQSQPGSRPTSPDRMVPLYDKDLIRMLAEVAFIQGEVITVWKLCITTVASYGRFFKHAWFVNFMDVSCLQVNIPLNFYSVFRPIRWIKIIYKQKDISETLEIQDILLTQRIWLIWVYMCFLTI